MMNEMNMQEPERGQQSEQEWQTNLPYGEYRAEYPGRYEPEQQQKVYPQAESARSGIGTILGIVAILLSSLGFFLALAGIVGSAIVLKYAAGQQALLAGGAIGLISSILVLLMFVAIFVFAVIALARPHMFRGWRVPRSRSRWR
ncbi:MAG: hypothetical protein ACRDIV_13770 [Ktedonobacteraceae bacterium]